MSRKGVGRIAPFCRIRILPPCSTTKKRLVLSRDVSMSRGLLKPVATDASVTETGPVTGGGVVVLPDELPPPQDNKGASTAISTTCLRIRHFGTTGVCHL